MLLYYWAMFCSRSQVPLENNIRESFCFSWKRNKSRTQTYRWRTTSFRLPCCCSAGGRRSLGAAYRGSSAVRWPPPPGSTLPSSPSRPAPGPPPSVAGPASAPSRRRRYGARAVAGRGFGRRRGRPRWRWSTDGWPTAQSCSWSCTGWTRWSRQRQRRWRRCPAGGMAGGTATAGRGWGGGSTAADRCSSRSRSGRPRLAASRPTVAVATAAAAPSASPQTSPVTPKQRRVKDVLSIRSFLAVSPIATN